MNIPHIRVNSIQQRWQGYIYITILIICVAVKQCQISYPADHILLRTTALPLSQTNLHRVIIILPCYIALMGVISNVQYRVLQREKANTYYGSLDTYHRIRFAAKSCNRWTRSVLKKLQVLFFRLDSFALCCQIINCLPIDFKSWSFSQSFIRPNIFPGDKSVKCRNSKIGAITIIRGVLRSHVLKKLTFWIAGCDIDQQGHTD